VRLARNVYLAGWFIGLVGLVGNGPINEALIVLVIPAGLLFHRGRSNRTTGGPHVPRRGMKVGDRIRPLALLLSA
jgi:hypothetical protein